MPYCKTSDGRIVPQAFEHFGSENRQENIKERVDKWQENALRMMKSRWPASLRTVLDSFKVQTENFWKILSIPKTLLISIFDIHM